MMIDLTTFIRLKKGLRISFALNFLAKNDFIVDQDNLNKLCEANKDIPCPHLNIFAPARFIPEMTIADVRDQVIENLYSVLDGMEADIKVEVPEDLKISE